MGSYFIKMDIYIYMSPRKHDFESLKLDFLFPAFTEFWEIILDNKRILSEITLELLPSKVAVESKTFVFFAWFLNITPTILCTYDSSNVIQFKPHFCQLLGQTRTVLLSLLTYRFEKRN